MTETRPRRFPSTPILLILAAAIPCLHAQPFRLPTANRHIFTSGAEEKFFVGTVGKPWTSGMFGCVRTGGNQLHEGIDIRCLQRDVRGEPVDPVTAAADGSVAYANRKPSLSNYGNYLILRHVIDGVEIFTTYAHLREIRADLKVGDAVKAGERVGTLGRTSNTREGISRDRAHVHFEINLQINERFPEWFKKFRPGERNDHGRFNGQNFAGFDPLEILRAQDSAKARFHLGQFIRSRTELCRVFIREPGLGLARRQPALVERNPVAEKSGVAGYEVSLSYAGAPVRLVPRAAGEIPGRSRFQLTAVNAAEAAQHPCRKLVTKRGTQWQLTSSGTALIELLAF